MKKDLAMKLFYVLCSLLIFVACDQPLPEGYEIEDSDIENTFLETTINFRILNEEGEDLLWGDKKLAESDIQVLYKEKGKKKVYFKKGVIAPWVHGFEIKRAKEKGEWIDGGYLNLHLIQPASPSNPISYTYLRLGEGKNQKEFTLKAEWRFERGKNWSFLQVLEVYLDGEPFWSKENDGMPVLIVNANS